MDIRADIYNQRAAAFLAPLSTPRSARTCVTFVHVSGAGGNNGQGHSSFGRAAPWESVGGGVALRPAANEIYST